MNESAATRELLQAARRAARLHALVRSLECAAAGGLGGAVVLAAGIASGAEVAADLVVVAFAIAGLTAVIAWRERPARATDVARRADRAAGLDGALGAVLDRARASASSSVGSSPGAASAAPVGSTVGDLLARRVRAVVRPGDLLRAALPRSPLALAAPLLAAALVALALERRPTSVVGPISRSAAGLRAAAEASRAAGDRAAADALEIAARRVDQLERAAARAASDPDARPKGRAEREQAAADLARLAQSWTGEESARALLLDAARALAAGDSGRPPEPGAGADPGVPSAVSGPGGAHDGEAAARSSFHVGLANAPGDGRMFGPPAGGESDPKSGGPTSGTVATGGAGRGVPSARWWPSRYDAVVERYLTP